MPRGNKSWITWIDRVCPICKKDFKARKFYVDRGKYVNCSKDCAYRAKSKRPYVTFDGKRYYKRTSGDWAHRDGQKETRLHRDKWEKYRGPIPKGYVIHHKDHDRDNNKMSNLELMEWGAHTTHHNRERANNEI